MGAAKYDRIDLKGAFDGWELEFWKLMLQKNCFEGSAWEVLEYFNQNIVYNGPIETKKALRLDMMQHAAMTT